MPPRWRSSTPLAIRTGFSSGWRNSPKPIARLPGTFFLGVFGADYLRGETDFTGEGLSGKQWLSAMNAMCRRAATVGFTNDSLGLHPGCEAVRQACLDLINRGQVVDGIAIPRGILDAPFPPEQKLKYFIEDGAVLDYDPGPG